MYNILNKMDNIIECSICMEKYNSKLKIPRILKCGHTFCSKCLEILAKKDINNNGFQCPIDKNIGHINKNINEIPINRLILDIIDMNNQNPKIEKKKLTHINEMKNKLKKYNLNYTENQEKIKESLNLIINYKQKCEEDIINYYNNIINKFIERKDYLLNILNIYCNEKNNLYSYILKHLEKLLKLININSKKLEIFQKENKNNNISLADEINLISSLGFETLEDNTFNKDLNLILNEIKGDIYPQIIVKENNLNFITKLFDDLLNNVSLNIEAFNLNNLNNYNFDYNNINVNYSMDFIKQNLSKKNNKLIQDNNKNNNNNNNLDLSASFSLLNISNFIEKNIISKILWFQQNSENIFSVDITNNNNLKWNKEENLNNFIIPEMFRVCQISNNSAFIIGGIYNMKCSNKMILYKENKFYKKINMFLERRNHACLKIDNYIYVCGGIDINDNPMSQCEKYNIKEGKWVKISDMKIEKSHLSLCNINSNYLYSFGGENKINGILDVIEKYNIKNDIWDKLELKLPISNECINVVKKNEKEILIMGGFNLNFGAIQSVLNFDVENMTIDILNEKLEKSGWGIFNPIKYENNIFVFLGGEENIQPEIVIYKC